MPTIVLKFYQIYRAHEIKFEMEKKAFDSNEMEFLTE